MSKEYRIYFGKKFSKNKNGYWICTCNKTPWAHRWVWINHNGTIPDGLDIHHIDGNKDNNEIENLEMISRSDHLKRHWEEGLFNIEQRREQLKDARKWLQTPEGKEKQRQDAIEGWKIRKTVSYECKACGISGITYQKKRDFCSDACRNRWKRQNIPNPVESICPMCKTIFIKDKSDAKIYCSRKCTGKMGGKLRQNIDPLAN